MVNVDFWTWLKINFKVTNFLIFVNVIMFFLTLLLGSLGAYSYIILGAQILPGTAYPLSQFVMEPWRMVTSAFLHGGFAHLILNMYALYSLGHVIEEYYGSKKVFAVYIFTALGAGLLSFIGSFIGFWQNNAVASGVSISVGASGAIFGLVGILLGYRYFKKKTYAPEIYFDERTLLFFVAFNLIFGFGVNALSMQVYINNWAHLGGLISGVVLGALLNTKESFSKSTRSNIFDKVFFYSALIIFIISIILTIISGLKLFLTL
jgi:rhomboid protease GluP